MKRGHVKPGSQRDFRAKISTNWPLICGHCHRPYSWWATHRKECLAAEAAGKPSFGKRLSTKMRRPK